MLQHVGCLVVDDLATCGQCVFGSSYIDRDAGIVYLVGARYEELYRTFSVP